MLQIETERAKLEADIQLREQDLAIKEQKNVNTASNDEMKSIIEDSCIGPAINGNVFPSTDTYNHWTSSNSRHQKSFKCSINTYNGSLTCRQARVLEQPFLLVQD